MVIDFAAIGITLSSFQTVVNISFIHEVIDRISLNTQDLISVGLRAPGMTQLQRSFRQSLMLQLEDHI